MVAVGGNLPGGFPTVREGLEAAVAALPSAGFEVFARSRWWTSEAWPDPAAPAYLNAVVLVAPTGEPLAALRRLKALERRFGREGGVRNAPRPVDLDLIAWGDAVMNTLELVLPHPRARERLFVMGPLAEVLPTWRLPAEGRNETAAALAARTTIGLDARPALVGAERPAPPEN